MSIKLIHTLYFILFLAIKELQESGGLEGKIIYCSGGERDKTKICKGALNLDLEIQNSPTTVPPELSLTNFGDKAFYLFTSGSTGLPKAAVIKNSRYNTRQIFYQ